MSAHYKDDLLETEYQSLLFGYAAGILDEAQTLIVAAHVAMSPRVRSLMALYENLGGSLIAHECEPVSLCESALDSVLAKIEAAHESAAKPAYQNLESALENIPEILASYLQEQECTLEWQNMFPGFEAMEIAMNCKRSQAHIIKADPDAITPQHTHGALEITLVLNGAYEDESGHYKRGDMVLSSENHHHTPKACSQMGCTSLMVSSRPYILTGK